MNSGRAARILPNRFAKADAHVSAPPGMTGSGTPGGPPFASGALPGPGRSPAAGSGASAWLKVHARDVRRWLGWSIASGVAQTALLCLQAALLAWGLHAAIFEQQPAAALVPAVSAYLLLALLRAGLVVAGRQFGFRAGREVVAAVRGELTGHLQALGPLWLAGRARGELVTRLIDGVEALEPYFARYLPQLAAAVALPLVVLAVAFPADWVGALVLLLTAPLVPLFMVLLGDRAARASERRWEVLTRLGEQFFDALQGLATLRLFGAGARERARLAAGSERYRRETMAVLRVAFLSSLVLEFFATLSIAVVAVLVGFRLLWGDVAFSRGMFVLLLAPEFYIPLRALGALRHARMDALAVAGDLDKLLAQPPPQRRQTARRAPPDTPPALAFEDVSFAYEPGRHGLDRCTLELPAGATLMVVGATGAGKSSLLQVLLGFALPQQGRVRIDDRDLDTLDLDAWRRQIAWLPQRPHLFAGSVRDNLLLARPQADAQALQHAAAAAGLDAVIEVLPAGWDTRIGEDGYGLSGGQAQRIGLARLLLRDAPLWLLDEPTRHLDPAGAEAIERTLLRCGAGRSVVWIAHRLGAAPHADAIALMQRGRVIEHGRHAALVAQGGAYAHLWQAQGAA